MDQHVNTSQPEEAQLGSGAPARPFFFDGLAGYFHDASGSTAILLLSPWGYEELCSRKSYRMLGEKLAASGFPCLRFDYPATGHSDGIASELDDSKAWHVAVKTALLELKKKTGADRVVVVGQGIGAGLAADLTESEPVAGLVMLAPVAQGRAYLRELAAWTAMTQPTFLVSASDGPEGGLMAGGFVLSRATYEEIKALNVYKMAQPFKVPTLLVERRDHPGDDKIATHLAESGTPVDRMEFKGYVDYVSDPTLSVVPETTLDRIVEWVAATFPATAKSAVKPADSAPTTGLWTAGLNEDLVRFGPDDMFFGALTRPKTGSPATAVLILNSGYDHAIGWARMAVGFSRSIAAGGSAVLRMDLAGMGESRYWPGQPAQVLYSDQQVEDVKAAVTWLKTETKADRVILVGRCSGAYLTLLAAEQDARVNGAFLINSRRLVWDPEEDVDQAIREPIQTLETYSRNMFDRETVKRVLSGEINLVSAVKKITRALIKKTDAIFAPLLRPFSKHYRLSSILGRRINVLKEREVPVELVYSQGDRGIGELDRWFGKDRKGLSKYPNVTVTFLADADHNLTPLKAREKVLSLLLEFVRD